MAGRRCPGRDRIGERIVACPTILIHGEPYCPRHTRARGTRQQRGYGTTHDALRADWQRRIDSGEIIHCADGCGARITGTRWQLGHTADRLSYLGPQTIACNERDGGRRGAHLSNATRRQPEPDA